MHAYTLANNIAENRRRCVCTKSVKRCIVAASRRVLAVRSRSKVARCRSAVKSSKLASEAGQPKDLPGVLVPSATMAHLSRRLGAPVDGSPVLVHVSHQCSPRPPLGGQGLLLLGGVVARLSDRLLSRKLVALLLQQ